MMRSLCGNLGILTVGLVALTARAEGLVAPKIPVGRETTYFNGPLDTIGEIDFETALNERLRGKTRPERNANVLLIQALGPAPDPLTKNTLPPGFFKWLETPALPEIGSYFIPITVFEPYETPLTEDERQTLYNQGSLAG